MKRWLLKPNRTLTLEELTELYSLIQLYVYGEEYFVKLSPTLASQFEKQEDSVLVRLDNGNG